MKRLKKADIQPTGDLVYTSGSSLDPHITPETVKVQIATIAQARGIEAKQLETLISQNTNGRFLGIFGEPGVNVLKLNLSLDHVLSVL
jgi:K+-transporting ATPase ATPase C chain